MVSVFDVAKYLLKFASLDEEAPELISNLKLQKLVFYCQGFSLAMLDKPLFLEPIEKWTHGPVCPALYHEYKQYKADSIPAPKCNIDEIMIGEQEKDVIDEVYSVYGQFSAWYLRELTHTEKAWIETPYNGTIDLELLKNSFKLKLVA